MKTVRRLLYFLLFAALTVLTQIGGVALFVSTMIVWAIVPEHKLSGARALPVHVSSFAAVYAVILVLFVPGLAHVSGRVALQCEATEQTPYGARSRLYCLFNRNYAAPSVKALLEAYSRDIAAAYPGTVTVYLDAGFPYLDGFPLPPHVTHGDGRKVDLAFYYTDASGKYLPALTPSPIGYWAFEMPLPGEEDRCAGAESALSLRWDMEWLQRFRAPYVLDEERTGYMLRWMVEFGREHGVTGLFIEPHLASRFGVASSLIGFAGCRAARHDDHLHVGVGED